MTPHVKGFRWDSYCRTCHIRHPAEEFKPACEQIWQSPTTMADALRQFRPAIPGRGNVGGDGSIFTDFCFNCGEHDSVHVNGRCLQYPSHFTTKVPI